MTDHDAMPPANRPEASAQDRLPGDPSREALIARMIRVDQAGEYGAVRIYEGQLAVLAEGEARAAIRAMAKTEAEHLAVFDNLLAQRRVRPTLLEPLWRLAGLALGAGTALLGARAAMACTVAVEDVIGEHYCRQAERLGAEEAELKRTIEAFRADEIAHRNEGLARGAEAAPAYEALSAAIRAGTKLAIWLSTRF